MKLICHYVPGLAMLPTRLRQFCLSNRLPLLPSAWGVLVVVLVFEVAVVVVVVVLGVVVVVVVVVVAKH